MGGSRILSFYKDQKLTQVSIASYQHLIKLQSSKFFIMSKGDCAYCLRYLLSKQNSHWKCLKGVSAFTQIQCFVSIYRTGFPLHHANYLVRASWYICIPVCHIERHLINYQLFKFTSNTKMSPCFFFPEQILHTTLNIFIIIW